MCHILKEAISTREHRLLAKQHPFPSKLCSDVEYASMIRKCSINMWLFGVLHIDLGLADKVRNMSGNAFKINICRSYRVYFFQMWRQRRVASEGPLDRKITLLRTSGPKNFVEMTLGRVL